MAIIRNISKTVHQQPDPAILDHLTEMDRKRGQRVIEKWQMKQKAAHKIGTLKQAI